MNLTSVLTTSGLTVALTSIVVYLAKDWIKTRLEMSIRQEYRKAFEDYRMSLQWESRRREEATQIAELLSFWVARNYDKTLNENAALFNLQRKYWEVALWLEAPVLKKLNKAFTGDEFATLQYKSALIEVRKAIIGIQDDIRPEDLVHWNPR